MALPIPRLAPVTMATLFVKRSDFMFAFQRCVNRINSSERKCISTLEMKSDSFFRQRVGRRQISGWRMVIAKER